MSHPENLNPINSFYPKRTQTIYSCKRNAWLLLDALKLMTPAPTFDTLLELSSALPSIRDRSFSIHSRLTIHSRGFGMTIHPLPAALHNILHFHLHGNLLSHCLGIGREIHCLSAVADITIFYSYIHRT